ncbi:MAG: hypothetical protein WD691_02080 [Acidimicrobiales bacterium]
MPFACPRCAEPSEARFYGPCSECRSALRAALGGDGRTIDREAFEPAMHVTPNAVALKDD